MADPRPDPLPGEDDLSTLQRAHLEFWKRLADLSRTTLAKVGEQPGRAPYDWLESYADLWRDLLEKTRVALGDRAREAPRSAAEDRIPCHRLTVGSREDPFCIRLRFGRDDFRSADGPAPRDDLPQLSLTLPGLARLGCAPVLEPERHFVLLPSRVTPEAPAVELRFFGFPKSPASAPAGTYSGLVLATETARPVAVVQVMLTDAGERDSAQR